MLLKKDDLKDLKDDAGVKDWEKDTNIAADRGASWMDGRFLQGTFTATQHPQRRTNPMSTASWLRRSVRLAAATTISTLILMADGHVGTITANAKLVVWKRVWPTRNGPGEVDAGFPEMLSPWRKTIMTSALASRVPITLFQLLIILAFLAILFALFLPALAKLRLTAARSQSANNLKQIGLAMHNYHDTNTVFPPGNDDNNFSALAYVLPYIEQGNLYNQIDFKKPIDDKANAAARARSSSSTFLESARRHQVGRGPLISDQRTICCAPAPIPPWRTTTASSIRTRK